MLVQNIFLQGYEELLKEKRRFFIVFCCVVIIELLYIVFINKPVKTITAFSLLSSPQVCLSTGCYIGVLITIVSLYLIFMINQYSCINDKSVCSYYCC